MKSETIFGQVGVGMGGVNECTGLCSSNVFMVKQSELNP